MYGRSEVLALLDSSGVEYEAVEHPPVFTIEGMLEAGVPHPDEIAKNLFLRDDKKRAYYVVVLRHEGRTDLKALRTAIGSRPLSMASEEDLSAKLGLVRGAVTPFGALNDGTHTVRVLVDSYFRGGRMGVHPNDNTCTVFVDAEEAVRLLADRGAPAGFFDLPVPERSRPTVLTPLHARSRARPLYRRAPMTVRKPHGMRDYLEQDALHGGPGSRRARYAPVYDQADDHAPLPGV